MNKLIDNGLSKKAKLSKYRVELLELRSCGMEYDDISDYMAETHKVYIDKCKIKLFINRIGRIEKPDKTLADYRTSIKAMAVEGKTTLFISKKCSKFLDKHVDSNQVELFILRNFKGITPVIQTNHRSKPRKSCDNSAAVLSLLWKPTGNKEALKELAA